MSVLRLTVFRSYGVNLSEINTDIPLDLNSIRRQFLLAYSQDTTVVDNAHATFVTCQSDCS